jgi:hypothetical protein
LTRRLVGSTIRTVGSEQREPSRIVPVGPVIPVRAPRAAPLIAIVAVLVGTAAFVAGLQLGGSRPVEQRPALVPSAPAASLAPVAAPSASLAGPPYASAFADAFRPPDLFAQFVGGAGCVSHNEQSQEAIGVAEYVLARTWTTFCPLEPSSRRTFVNDLVAALSAQMPDSRKTEASNGPDSTLALFAYTQNRFVGTVSLSAEAAGSGFQIVISLKERRAP